MGSYTVLTKSSESKLDKEIQKLIKPYYKDLQDTLRAYDSESSGYV